MADIDPSILAEFGGDEAKARRYLALVESKKAKAEPKAEAPKKAPAPRAAMERAARPVDRAVEPVIVPDVAPVVEPTIDATTAQREIGKQRTAFDAAYQAGVDRYRREHDPRDEAFREHNEEIASIVTPVARMVMERAAYPVRKAWEGMVAADAAYDALPVVRDARARFADAENRPAPERPKPTPAAAKVPTIEMPEVPVETPPSPGFTVTEEFQVGEEPKREPSPAQSARRALVKAGMPVDEARGLLDNEAIEAAKEL